MVTDNKEKIEDLAGIRTAGSQFLAGAPVVIAVLGEPEEQEMWVEDCSIAAVSMQYQAEDLGLGSCWCHIRGRESKDAGVTAEPADERKPQNEEALKWDQVSYVH